MADGDLKFGNLPTLSTKPASGDFFTVLDSSQTTGDNADASGQVKKISPANALSGRLENIVEDTTPQLGGMLDRNGFAIGDGTRELLTFVEDGSAVNHIEIENEATGSGPILRAAGDDTDIDLHLEAKGDGDIHADNPVHIDHTAANADDHSLEVIVDAAGFGDVKAIEIQYDTGAISSGEDEAIILVDINEVDATGGDIIALDVLATDGGADDVWAVGAGATVGPVRQQSGVFANPVLWDNNGVDETSEVTGAGTSSVFVADNDFVIVTFATKFSEIEIELNTAASGAGIAPTFEFSTGGSGFTAFTPIDGTDGFKFTGIMAWDESDIPTWATNTSGNFEIRITRTRNSLSITPIVDTAQVADVTDYTWDKDGNLTINSLFLAEKAAADADVAVQGQFWAKTTNKAMFTGPGGNDYRLLTVASKSVTIENPTSSELADLFITDRAITIYEVQVYLRGSATPTVTWNIQFGTDPSAAGTNLFSSGQVTTVTASIQKLTSGFNDATIPADNALWFDSSAKGGTVTSISLTIFYTED